MVRSSALDVKQKECTTVNYQRVKSLACERVPNQGESNKTKQETRVVKINRNIGRLKTTESSWSGIQKDVENASLVFNLSDGQSRSEKLPTSF